MMLTPVPLRTIVPVTTLLLTLSWADRVNEPWIGRVITMSLLTLAAAVVCRARTPDTVELSRGPAAMSHQVQGPCPQLTCQVPLPLTSSIVVPEP